MGDVRRMLSECAPGHRFTPKTHRICVTWNGVSYWGLPKGPHGRRDGREEIEAGHVRKMARHLRIEDCARRMIPGL
jgi:hypothetical protein